MSFLGWLCLLFIALKLTGHIDWPWLLVLAPVLVPMAITLVIFAVAFVVAGVLTLFFAITDRS